MVEGSGNLAILTVYLDVLCIIESKTLQYCTAYGTTCNLNGENTYYSYGFGALLHEFNRTNSTCSLELIDIVLGKYFTSNMHAKTNFYNEEYLTILNTP